MSLDPRADDTAARVLLSRLVEPGDARVGSLVLAHGAVEVASRVLDGAAEVAACSARLPTGGASAAVGQVATDLEQLHRLGGRILRPGTVDWPSQLDDLGPRAPLLLWQRGAANLRLTALRSVSVVGARACTRYGEVVAADLAFGLAECGWTVVSGGAYGIDAAAHRGALAGGGASVAVLACGVDIVYPRGHQQLFDRLCQDGAVLAEVAPGSVPYRGRFLVRNRVIAALTRGTVVVEAALRSGSLSTARAARDLSRVVMGVPGPVTSAMSAGVHRELREGGLLVSTVAEVVEAVGELGADLAPRQSGPERVVDRLDPSSRRVLDALPGRGSMLPEQVARLAGLDVSAAVAALGLLELTGLVGRDRDGWRLTRRPD